jgi:hypothetical protein
MPVPAPDYELGQFFDLSPDLLNPLFERQRNRLAGHRFVEARSSGPVLA